MQLITAAIASAPHRDSDASTFLRAHNKSESSVRRQLVGPDERVACSAAAGWLVRQRAPAASYALVSDWTGCMHVLVRRSRHGATYQFPAASQLLVPAAGHAEHAD